MVQFQKQRHNIFVKIISPIQSDKNNQCCSNLFRLSDIDILPVTPSAIIFLEKKASKNSFGI